MSITSDLIVFPSSFNPSNIPEETHKVNGMLEAIGTKGPNWYDVGVSKYQAMREAGETSLPAPVYLPNAVEATLPSREPGRDIPLRVYKPDNGKPSKGIFLHFHGGGFVLGNHQSQDQFLSFYANEAHLTAISVGYRHAPASPYPSPIHDCIDAVLYLADHAITEYGSPFLFMGGESAGACCAVLAAFALLRARPTSHLAGLILSYGWFDMTLSLPSIATSSVLRLIDLAAMQKFREAYLPSLSDAAVRHPDISPLFADLEELRGQLPPALFLVGTADPLLDDTLLMGVKWMAAGAEAVVKVWPGAPHGFTAFPAYGPAEEARAAVVDFAGKRLGIEALVDGLEG